jgi:hypothetical protein
MKLSLKKLSQSGFSHFELLVIIGVTVVVAGVGTFVYSKVHKSHAGTAHYTYVGSAIAKTNPIDFYACKQLNPGGQTYTFNFTADNFSSKMKPTVRYSVMSVDKNNKYTKEVASYISSKWISNMVSASPVSTYVSSTLQAQPTNPSYVSNVSYASYGKMAYSTQTYKVILSTNNQVKITLEVNGSTFIPQYVFNPTQKPSYISAKYISNCTD